MHIPVDDDWHSISRIGFPLLNPAVRQKKITDRSK